MENRGENKQESAAANAADDGGEVTKVVSAENGNAGAERAYEQPKRHRRAGADTMQHVVF